MAFAKPLRIASRGRFLVLSYGSGVLAKISKASLQMLVADLNEDGVRLEKDARKPSKRIAVVVKKPEPTDREVRAGQLVRAYREAKRKHYKRKVVQEISATDAVFKFFLKAIDIIDRHDVPYKTYLQAQVLGLKFLNNGRGKFPEPSMLATDGAETRLLEYLSSDRSVTGEELEVAVSSEERNTPLSENSRYRAGRQKIKDRLATLHEALYVRTLQQLRRGEVDADVEKYIARLSGGKRERRGVPTE